MKSIASAFIAAASSLLLAACGGGGGGNTPVPPPPQVFANTSLSFYLPLATGNTWTFATGGKIVDSVSHTISCACLYNGRRSDSLDLIDPSGTYGSSFIFTKFFDGTNNGVLTTVLLGTSTDHGATVSYFGSGANIGIPVMNDAPVQGKSYTNSGITATITSVGQTQALPDGRFVRNVATGKLTQSGAQDITFGFAQGVGFTSVAVGTQTTNLASFSVDVTNSASVARGPQSERRSVATKTASPSNLATALSPLF